MYSNKGITLGEFAKKLDATLSGGADKLVRGLNTLPSANKEEVSFLARPSYLKDLKKTKVKFT